MDPAAPVEEGSYSFCPTCGAASVPGETRCHGCGRMVRIPRTVWSWVVGVAGMLEAGWALLHSRSAVEVLLSAIGAVVLVGAAAWLLVSRLSRLNRRGGPSLALGAAIATLVTAVLCLPIFTAMGRDDVSTTFAFSVTMLLMPPLIGIPAGALLARGSRTHVPLRTCRHCDTYRPPDASFCPGCGREVDPERR